MDQIHFCYKIDQEQQKKYDYLKTLGFLTKSYFELKDNDLYVCVSQDDFIGLIAEYFKKQQTP